MVVPIEPHETTNLNNQIYPVKEDLKTDKNDVEQVATSHSGQKEDEVEELNSFAQLSIILMSIQSGFFQLGYSLAYLTMSFSTVFSQITLKGSETSEQGLFSAVMSIGQVVGAVLTYFLLKYTTRNQSLLIADMCGILSILEIIPNREVILTFRFFFGVCLGISCIVMPIYVKELCPNNHYEKFAVFGGFCVSGGLLFVILMGLGYLNNDLRGPDTYYWQIIFAIPAVISFYRMITVTVIYKMDSPISLLQRNKVHECKQILKLIYKERFHDKIYNDYLQQINNQHSEGFLSIFTKKHLKTLTIGLVLMLSYTWSGMFAVFSYSSQFFASMAKDDQTLNTIFVLILGVIQFIPTLLSPYVYGRWSKRTLLLSGLGVMIICQVLIIGLSYSDELSAVIVKYIVICCFSFTYALTLAPIAVSLTPEINTSEGNYFSFLTLFTWQLILLYIFPFMLDTLSMSGSFIVFVIVTILSTIFFFVFVKETKGLSHAEIDKLYGKMN